MAPRYQKSKQEKHSNEEKGDEDATQNLHERGGI
jgi:hypothetical protein